MVTHDSVSFRVWQVPQRGRKPGPEADSSGRFGPASEPSRRSLPPRRAVWLSAARAARSHAAAANLSYCRQCGGLSDEGLGHVPK